MKRLAIVTSHPIQYNAPLFKLLTERGNIQVRVFYTWSQSEEAVYDPGFGQVRSWDIPLLEGYDYEFVQNVAKDPGSSHFRGLINPGLHQKIENWNADSILVFGWSFVSHLKVMRYFKGKKKIIFRGDSTLLGEHKGFSVKKLLRRSFLKWVYSYIDAALYVGQNNKDYFLKHGVKVSQLFLAPHCIDNARFDDPSGTVEATARTERAKLGIPAEAIVFVYAGKLYGLKDVDVLINAFRSVTTSLPLRLLIIGNGQDEEKLKQLASGDDRILFQSFRNQSEMPLVYRLGDIFVLPSKSETWGLAINEAMACARPVIISDKCGCGTDLVTPDTGYIFEAGNVSQLAEHINEYQLRGAEGVKQMGRSAKAKIQDFSYEKQAIALEKAVID